MGLILLLVVLVLLFGGGASIWAHPSIILVGASARYW